MALVSEYIVSFSQEISVKSRGTKEYFISKVKEALVNRAKKAGAFLSIEPLGFRFVVRCDELGFKLLTTQFGLSRLASFERIKLDELEKADISCITDLTLKVKRWFNKERDRKLLEKIKAFCGESSVLEVEFYEDEAFVLSNPVRLLGGFPVGVGARVLQLFSGGPDSVLATLLLARRGQEVVLLYMDTGSNGWDKVVDAAKNVAFFMPELNIRLLKVDYRPFLEEICSSVPSRHVCLYCKAVMLKIAEKLASNCKAEAISTGEIIGEQASQTLPVLSLLSRISERLVVRPLAAFNKEEVFEKLRAFGLDSSFSMPDCPYHPKRPITFPSVSFSLFKKRVLALSSGDIKLEEFLVSS